MLKNDIIKINEGKILMTIDGGVFVEVVKIARGQVTLPLHIRQRLNLDYNGKIAFLEKDGQYILANPTVLAFEKIQAAMHGEAERLGLNDVDDVTKMIKDMRKEL